MDRGRFGFGAETPPAGSINGRQRVQSVNLDLVGTLPVTRNLAFPGRVGAVCARARASTEASLSPASTATSERGRAAGSASACSTRSARRSSCAARRNATLGARRRQPPQRPSRPLRPYPPRCRRPCRNVAASATRRRRCSASTSRTGWPRAGRSWTALPQNWRTRAATRSRSRGIPTGWAALHTTRHFRCAETVKHDVVTSGRMDPARISALGLGQTRPVTRPADCVAKQRSPALLKCLQLDRRVEIEAVGTR